MRVLALALVLAGGSSAPSTAVSSDAPEPVRDDAGAAEQDATAEPELDAGVAPTAPVDAGPATTATVKGTIGGVGLPKAWAIFRTGGGSWALEISNDGDACARMRRRAGRSGMVNLTFVPHTAATAGPAMVATGALVTSGCDAGVLVAFEPAARLTLTTLTAAKATGTFELKSDAGTITGTFAAPFCDVPLNSQAGGVTCED